MICTLRSLKERDCQIMWFPLSMCQPVLNVVVNVAGKYCACHIPSSKRMGSRHVNSITMEWIRHLWLMKGAPIMVCLWFPNITSDYRYFKMKAALAPYHHATSYGPFQTKTFSQMSQNNIMACDQLRQIHHTFQSSHTRAMTRCNIGGQYHRIVCRWFFLPLQASLAMVNHAIE